MAETKHIEVYQLIISVLIVLGSLFTTWLNVNSRLAIIETKEIGYENNLSEIKADTKHISEVQTQILIEMQNKKNK